MWKILYEINTPKDRGELKAHKRSQKRNKIKNKEGTNGDSKKKYSKRRKR
jgi:hypothetical protein